MELRRTYMDKGFSLIEIIVSIGIFSCLMATTVSYGMPEYYRFILNSEKNLLLDFLQENYLRNLVSSTSSYILSTWSDGYCIKDFSNLCITPVHNFPTNMKLTSNINATNTKLQLQYFEYISPEIFIDEKGNIKE